MTSDQIESQKPAHWEYLLFASLLEEQLPQLHRQYDALKLERWKFAQAQMDASATCRFSSQRLQALPSKVAGAERLLNIEFPTAMGPFGLAGNPGEIRRVASEIVAICESFYEGEVSLHQVKPDAFAVDLYSRLFFLTEPWLIQIESLPSRIREILTADKPGSFTLEIRFTVPALENLPEFRPLIIQQNNSLITKWLAALGLVFVVDWLFGNNANK